jgi:tetratricopeptide (TPR) repeat protein
MKSAALALTLLMLVTLAAANPRVEVKRGNGAAVKGKADEALTHYKKALDQQADTSVVMYNLGNVLYGQQKFEDAERSFIGALEPGEAPLEQSETMYNLGNTYYQSQKYDQAIGAYVEALKRNADDEDARYNLELARRMLQQQKQEQQKQDKENENKEQKPDSSQQQQKPDSSQQDQKKDQPQDQQQQDQQQQDQQQQQEQQQPGQPQQERQMSKEEAERLLNALLSNEQDALKDVKKVKVAKRKKREKDW